MTTNRKKHKQTDYDTALYGYHKAAAKHVVVMELSLSEDEKRKIFADADRLRQCGNQLLGIMKRNLEQLLRTKRYRNLQKLYGRFSERIKTLNSIDELSDEQQKELKQLSKDRDGVSSSMSEMQESYHVTWDFCRKQMETLRLSYGIDSIFALSRAEDIWSAVSKVLYSTGKQLHFKKRGELPEIRAKQRNRGIIIALDEDGLGFRYSRKTFRPVIKKGDRWLEDEIQEMMIYLRDPLIADAFAIHEYLDHRITDTYRPCFASLVCKIIRGKLRVFAHVTVEGHSLPKYRTDGTMKHTYGTGQIGGDIGTQTLAYSSNTEVGLKNLAERGTSITKRERQERILHRAMDRSRRATNPENYNADGTIRKGKKIWKKSNRYRKLQQRHQELARIAAENRRLAINEDVNHLRSLGNVFVTEEKNAAKLAKKAKETTVNKKGKINRKKRFGKSIQNRCPGYFQKQVEQKFTSTGGIYIEVPKDYRASQYDHTVDDYIKKKLSDRMYALSDGTIVQRDWYSSYLLYCFDIKTNGINKTSCKRNFETMHKKSEAMIQKIIASGKKVFNSGIKAA